MQGVRSHLRERRRTVTVVFATAVASLVASAPATAQDVEALQRKADRAATAMAEAEGRVGALDAQIADLNARAAAAKARTQQLRDAVQEAVIARLMHGDVELATLAADDPNERAIAGVLGEVATQSGTDAIEQFLAATDDAQRAGEELRRRRDEASDALDDLRDQRDAVDEQLEALRRAQRSNPAAPRDSRSASSEPIVNGEWVCPVQGPVTFSDSWGDPRSGGRSHTGVDMLSPKGTPTVAPVTGRVVHRRSELGGLTWYVYGDDGNTYYGAHLSSYANEGIGRVQGGTVIGFVGATGNANGTNHLHFQIKPGGGAAVNPYPTVAKYC